MRTTTYIYQLSMVLLAMLAFLTLASARKYPKCENPNPNICPPCGDPTMLNKTRGETFPFYLDQPCCWTSDSVLALLVWTPLIRRCEDEEMHMESNYRRMRFQEDQVRYREHDLAIAEKAGYAAARIKAAAGIAKAKHRWHRAHKRFVKHRNARRNIIEWAFKNERADVLALRNADTLNRTCPAFWWQ